MAFLIFFSLSFFFMTLYCLFFSFFNYIYVLIFLDLLILSLVVLLLNFVIVFENLNFQNFALIILGVGACETAVGLLLFVSAYKIQPQHLFQ